MRRELENLAWGILVAIFLALFSSYEAVLLDGARLVILGKLTLCDLDEAGRDTLLWAVFAILAAYVGLWVWQTFLSFLPAGSITRWDADFGNLTWTKLWDHKDELLLYPSAIALLRDSATKLAAHVIDDRQILECRVRGIAVMCINEAAAESNANIVSWLREAGGAWNAKVIAVQRQKVSEPMEWFPDQDTRLRLGDVLFLSCDDTVRIGSADSESHAMKLALYLAKGNKQLVRDVELACSPLVESMPDWLCGSGGVLLGPPDSDRGGLDFRKISGGITLASIVHDDTPKWFPKHDECVHSGDSLLVVTAILRDGNLIFQQKLPELREHLRARLLDKNLFEALGGRLPFGCPARPALERARSGQRLVRQGTNVFAFGPLRT